MRLDEAVALYLLNTTNPRTRETYAYSLNPMVAFIGPARDLNQVSPLAVGEYADFIRSKDSAEATKAKHIKAIKVFFNWLVNNDFLDKSPARVVKSIRVQPSQTREKAIEDEELFAILDYAKWDARKYSLLLFLADTGCRAGGASNLRASDIDLPRKTARVTEKGDITRKVWFGDQCRVALITWLSRRSGAKGDYVFSRDGRQIQPASISQIIFRCCLAAGVNPRRSHSIRHWKGHTLADDRVPAPTIQKVLGHKSMNSTWNYMPHDDETAYRAVQEHAIREENKQKDAKIIYFADIKRG